MSAPVLRPYQVAACEAVDQIRDSVRRILGVSPTGSGKTVIAAELCRREIARGGQVLFLAPRRELIQQTFEKLEHVGIIPGVLLAGDKRQNLFAPVQLASVDTLRARIKRVVFRDPTLIIVDEAHCYVTEVRKGLLDRWPAATVVGLTATPCRKDGRGLGVLFDHLVEVATTAELTGQGHLVPARYFSISKPDLTGVRTVGGDYNQGETATRMRPLVGDIPLTWLQRAGGRRTVVFCVNVRHSIWVRDAFLRHGVAAEHVDGTTPTEARAAIFERFRAGTTQVLCNCMIATIGFDLPELDCVVLARPTKSLALYLQMLGRGLRTTPDGNKKDLLVLDHSGAVHTHGLAADERVWALDGHADLSTQRGYKREHGKDAHKIIECPNCKATFRGSLVCPECGHYLQKAAKPVPTQAGELVPVQEVSRESTAEQQRFHAELRAYAASKGFRGGWAAHKFKEKFGHFPPWDWNSRPTETPSITTQRWLQSRYIAWRKAQQRQGVA